MIQTPEPSDSAVTSDRVVLWLLFVIGALPVASAIIHGERWGVFASLGLLMTAVAVYGLIRLAHDRKRTDKG